MRVMIVEDQTMIRSLLESYFHAEDGYRITASIPGAKQAVEVCRTSSVDLILMDVQTENCMCAFGRSRTAWRSP